MKSWKRITLVSFVLIGGTAYFSYWSLNQFNQTLDDLSSALYLASTRSIYPSFQQNTGLASTSLEISGELATSTDETITATSTPITATSTPATATGSTQPSPEATAGTASSPQATSTQVELSFTFPQKGTGVYIGCTYSISWQSSTAINSLETALVDAGARESVGPIASGLAKENTIERDVQNLNWKVGNVWPGAYYIKVSKINGVEAEFRSKVFEINKMPEGINKEEKINICRESSG